MSAGILMYRLANGAPSVLLVHPGGPFWAKRDLAAWSIPKGELGPGENAELCARREFHEELGIEPIGTLEYLGRISQRRGKYVEAFALKGNLDVADVHSNTFEMEWPPGSGRMQSFPEVDRAEWFPLPLARKKILPGQTPLLDRLEAIRIAKR